MSKKVDSSQEAYKSRGAKTKQTPVGSHESTPLSEGYNDCSDGNDGSKAPASAPDNKHQLKKYSK